MRELFFKLFEMSHFNTGIMITPFSVAHIVYNLLIGGSITLGWLLIYGIIHAMFRLTKKSSENAQPVHA